MLSLFYSQNAFRTKTWVWFSFCLKCDRSWPMFFPAALLSSLKKLITHVVCLCGSSVISQSKHIAPSCLLGFLCSQNTVRLTSCLAFSCLNCYHSWSMFCPAAFSFSKNSIDISCLRGSSVFSQKSPQLARMSAWLVLPSKIASR